MRPGRCGRLERHVARRSRIWADDDGLHVVAAAGHRRWRTGAGGLNVARYVHTAADDLDQGVDPLAVDPFGHLELPGQASTAGTRVELKDWLSDIDQAAEFEVSHPLEVSGMQAVLDRAGVQVDLKRARRSGDSRPAGSGHSSFLSGREPTKLVVILVACLLGMVGYVGGPAAVPCGAAAVLISAAVLIAIRIPTLQRLRAERSSRWHAALELRPGRQAGLRRGFLRNTRLCVVDDELVVVDGAGGELWLGREAATGVAVAARLVGHDGPVRVELRRGDGTSLARLPWEDWFAADDGAALRQFCAAASLPLVDAEWRPSRRDGLSALTPAVPSLGSAGLAVAQRLGPDAAGASMPAAVAAVPCLATLPVANEGGAGVAVAVLAALVIILAAGPSAVDVLRRRRDLRVLR
ncbi:MAG TPA: hypothetical protein VM347_34570 [Nonomuraea sp.]|nr:hypothetical protein [Nonomuraea sp.]